MNKKLEVFKLFLKDNFDIQFEVKSGVPQGNIIIGRFDTGETKKFAVIVKYPNWIESTNKQFGTKLLLSQEAYKKIGRDISNLICSKLH